MGLWAESAGCRMGGWACALTDPEVVGLDWVADGDVPTGSLVVVAIETEPSDASCGMELPDCALV